MSKSTNTVAKLAHTHTLTTVHHNTALDYSNIITQHLKSWLV